MCQQTVEGFQILIRETVSDSISLRVMKKYNKSSFLQILAVFRTL